LITFYITYFYNVRFFKPYEIPISTAFSDPKWYHKDSYNKNLCFIDNNGVINGIREDSLHFSTEMSHALGDDMCSGPESCKYTANECPFLCEYFNYLQTIDFNNYLIPELTRVAIDAKKLLGFEEEPRIILLVHEKPDNPCSERWALIDLFRQHNTELIEWRKGNEC